MNLNNNTGFQCLIYLSLTSMLYCSLINQKTVESKKISKNQLAIRLKESGYNAIFQYGDHTLLDSFWQKGKNREVLEEIVEDSQTNGYSRLLASEILYTQKPEYPDDNTNNVLPFVYAHALVIAGQKEGSMLSGNLWGFMYFSDNDPKIDYGPLGSRLIEYGTAAVPFLIDLLEDDNLIYYEGSQEATIGNNQKYRVKDAAAYYIGKITGARIPFHPDYKERDIEIDHLKTKLK